MFTAQFTLGTVTLFAVIGVANAGASQFTVLDQIGSLGDSWMLGASSSQFSPGDPQGAFTTVDNFTITEPTRITRVEGVIGGLQNFVSFDLIDSWTVQIYSSLSGASKDFFGDALSVSFDTPTSMTNGFSSFLGFPSEITSFDIDVVLQPGEYWLGIAMGNDGKTNGTIGVRASIVGDGPAFFAVPSQGSSFALSAPAAYRIFGETVVPAPGAVLLLIPLGLPSRRRRVRPGRVPSQQAVPGSR